MKNRFAKFEILGAEGTERIDRAARRILERTGVVLPHEEALRLFERAGAAVDYSDSRLRIPSPLVDECLAAAGKTFTLYGRDPSITASFGTGARNYNSIAGEAHWLDRSGQRRPASSANVIEAGMLADVLPRFNIAGAMADPQEIPPDVRCVETAASLIRTTVKPVTFWFNDRPGAEYVMELLSAVTGTSEEIAEKPLTYAFLEPISPLRFPRNGVDLLFATAKAPLPVSIGPMAQAGISAPVTLAGTIAQETAEILAGICLVELIRPGTPVCFGGIPHAFDMRTTQLIFAGPEQGLMAVAMTEMGKRYGLPVYINVGLTDSKCVDAQAGLEIGATLLLGALAGADIFGHFGIAGVDQASSPAMLVFQHETIEYVERVLDGFLIDDNTLALDLIDSVGPGGMFIAEEHTVAHFREELWMPTILDRSFWDSWERGGRVDTAQRAADRVEEILARYRPHPLPDDVEREFSRILESARKRLA